jgi:multiple sugar transport system substrate-binding protein
MASGNQDGAQRPFISTFGLNRRDLVKSALVAGGTLVWAGTGRANRVVAQDKVNLVQWYHQYGEEGTQDAVTRYAQQFTEANPDITVEVVWQTGDYGPALAAALLTDDAPDVFEQSGITLDQVNQNQIAPLDDLYTDEVRADFNEVGLQRGTIDGKIYWVKMVDDTGAFYFRKSQFADAGIEPPTTLEGLLEMANALNQGRQKGIFLGNDGGVAAGLGPFCWSAGGTYLNADNTEVAFNTDAVAASYAMLKDFNDSGALLIGAPTDFLDPSAFIQQLAAVQWTGLWALPQIMREVGEEEVDVFPWPAAGADGKPATFWGGWGECVNGNGQNIEAAKELVRWLWIENTEIQQDWCLAYGFHVPPRKSAAESAEQLKSGPAAKFVQYINEYAVIDPPYWTPAMGTALTEAANNIKGGAKPKAELDKAAQTAQADLDRLLGT